MTCFSSTKTVTLKYVGFICVKSNRTATFEFRERSPLTLSAGQCDGYGGTLTVTRVVVQGSGGVHAPQPPPAGTAGGG